jgi:hypothetical protein
VSATSESEVSARGGSWSSLGSGARGRALDRLRSAMAGRQGRAGGKARSEGGRDTPCCFDRGSTMIFQSPDWKGIAASEDDWIGSGSMPSTLVVQERLQANF